MTTMAHALLTDNFTFHLITGFQRGLPRDMVEEIRAIRQRSVMRTDHGPQETTVPQVVARRGDIRYLERILKICEQQPEYASRREFQFSRTWMAAVSGGSVETARWIVARRLDRSHIPLQNALKCAIASGDSDTVAYVIAWTDGSRRAQLKQSHVELAIKLNAVAVLEWLDTNIDRVPYPPNPQLLAAEANALGVIQYLHQPEYPSGWTSDVMDAAAAHGDSNMVQFLHENRSEGCTHKAMDGAATNGHLEIVRFLHEHRREGCTTNAMDDAATNGHIEIVRFLHDNRSEGCTTRAMDDAAINGHFEIVRFLHEKQKVCTTKAMDDAAAKGNLEMVRWFHEHRSEGCTTKAMDDAATNGHLDVVRFLHEQRDAGCTTQG